jgi:hypothetical protein
LCASHAVCGSAADPSGESGAAEQREHRVLRGLPDRVRDHAGVHHAPAADSLPRDLAKIVSHLIDTFGLDGFVHSTDVGRAGA